MVKILCMGDFHHPSRDIVNLDEIKYIYKKLKPDIVVLTGDYTEESFYRDLVNIFKNSEVFSVKGNSDLFNLDEYQIFKLGNFKFLVYHGHGIYPRGDVNKLSKLLEKFDCNVLITGHTHKPLYYYSRGLHIVNPGSYTGVYSGEDYSINLRSFCLLYVNSKTLNVRFYTKIKNV